ncbi:MAG: DinB family protein [Chitinophagaceae bacterium]
MANEINRIVKLFADLQHGQCWVGINFKEALQQVDAAGAGLKRPGMSNTIWELVSHITYWRTRVVNRLTGSDNPPPFADFLLPDIMEEAQWRQTNLDFEAAYHLLRNAIQAFHEENLDKPSPKEGQTFYQLIMGCLQHDAYHLGQIVAAKNNL